MRALKIPIQPLLVQRDKPDIAGAFRAAAKARINAIIPISTAALNRYNKQLAALAIRNRVPAMSEKREDVEVGGLTSYSSDDGENFRRAAVFVDKILKGTKPADLPVEQPTKFEFLITLKAAK